MFELQIEAPQSVDLWSVLTGNAENAKTRIHAAITISVTRKTEKVQKKVLQSGECGDSDGHLNHH